MFYFYGAFYFTKSIECPCFNTVVEKAFDSGLHSPIPCNVFDLVPPLFVGIAGLDLCCEILASDNVCRN